MFKEGKWYYFTIVRTIDIPQKGLHYILGHESGKKLLLPAQYYVKYNLKEGATIRCRIDKINCTGQVFLEPEHPIYKPGKYYHFPVKRIRVSPLSNTSLVDVEDVFGNEVSVIVPENETVGSASIRLKVINVKKGIPILLSPKPWVGCPEHYEEGQMLQVFLKSTYMFQDEEYYLLETQCGCKAILKAKHYKHYEMVKGKPVQAIFRGFNADGTLKIDPLHPLYQLGEKYTFSVSSFEHSENLAEEGGTIAVVYDHYGMKCGVRIADSSVKIGSLITCKVVGYRKGRPLLEVVP